MYDAETEAKKQPANAQLKSNKTTATAAYNEQLDATIENTYANKVAKRDAKKLEIS